MSFANKTAVVTGGCGGLGAAISKAFLDAGANVVALDINADLIKTFSETHVASAAKLLALETDITSEEAVAKAFADAVSKFGQVDVLVNNAGIMDKFEPVGELRKALWDRVLAVNLTGPYLTSHQAAAHMTEKGIRGSIVNVSSVAGTTGWSAGAVYTASKWGLLGLTKNTAAFYRDKGIRCNAIMPGPMQTNIAAHLAGGDFCQEGMALMQKKTQTMGPGSPLNEVAGLVLFLASDANSTLSGATIPIDSAWASV